MFLRLLVAAFVAPLHTMTLNDALFLARVSKTLRMSRLSAGSSLQYLFSLDKFTKFSLMGLNFVRKALNDTVQAIRSMTD